MVWTHAGPAIVASFLASFVAFVEALTIVLAVGTVRGCKSALAGGAGFETFPSGHTTAMCAVATVLWLYYPRYRAVYVLVVMLVSVRLLDANYHFISDVLAGCFLGGSIALVCVHLFRARKPPLDDYVVQTAERIEPLQLCRPRTGTF